MKQTVNLFTDDIRPVVRRLTLDSLMGVAALLLFVVLAAWVYSAWSLNHTEARQTAMQDHLARLNAQQAQLKTQIDQRQPDQQLVSESDSLSQQIDGQQRLNQLIADSSGMAEFAPAELMSDLEQVDVDGLWLTRFSSGPNGLTLEGLSIRANLIPRWMRQFGQTQLLQQAKFEVVGLDQNDQGQHSFTLTNDGLLPKTEDVQ